MTTVDSVTELSDAGKAAGRPWDTSDPFFTASTRDLLETAFKCFIRQIIMYAGIVGNVVCCVVFYKQGLSDRINLLLFWLAVGDCLHLAFQLPSTLPCYLSDTLLVNNINVVLSTNINRMITVCGYISGALIVVMSVERCLYVVIPFKARRLLSYRSMVTAILLSYLIPFFSCLPLVLADSVEWRLDPSTNRSLAYMVPTSWFPAGRYQTLVPTYLNLIGQPLSFIAVIACSVVTIVHLRRTSLKRIEMTGKTREEGRTSAVDNRLTVMLLFVSIVYAVLCVFQVCSNMIMNMIPEFFVYKKYHNSFIVLYHVFLLTASCVNSTVNFCAYLVLSSRFRKTLKETCVCVCR